MTKTSIRSILAAVLFLVPVSAGARTAAPEDDRSKNITQLANVPIKMPTGEAAAGSDLAFEKNLIVAGSYEGTAIFKISKGAPYVKQVGFHNCPGGQGD